MRFRTINHLIRAGTYIATRPRYYTTYTVGGYPYYYWNNAYYTSSGTGYVVVNPPPTIVVNTIPAQATLVHTSSDDYYYAGGTYYVATDESPTSGTPSGSGAPSKSGTEETKGESDSNYKVVTPPIGVTVPYKPEDAKEKTVNGSKYYVTGNSYYQAFSNGGKTIYVVVEDPTKSS